MTAQPAANVAKWQIDWGDGTAQLANNPATNTLAVTHTFGNATDVTVKVSALDIGNNLVGYGEKFIQGVNVPPDVNASANFTVETGAIFGLDLASFNDPGSTGPLPETYHASVNWGDGTPTTIAKIQEDHRAGEPLTLFYVIGDHRYTADGTYTVSITVVDSDGGTTTQTATLVSEKAEPYEFPVRRAR